MDTIKIGDLVEDCSLMPGVVMKVDEKGDDVEIRRLDLDYTGPNYSHCSLKYCGIQRITAQDALNRLKLGKDKLSEIWEEFIAIKDLRKDLWKTYNEMIITKINSF